MWLVARWGQMRWCDVMWLSCYVNVMWCDVMWLRYVMLWAVVWCDVMRCDVVVMQWACAIWCDDVVNWQVSCCHDTCHRKVTPQLPWLLLSVTLPFRAFSFAFSPIFLKVRNLEVFQLNFLWHMCVCVCHINLHSIYLGRQNLNTNTNRI